MKLRELKTIIDNLENGRWELPVNKLLLREAFNNEQTEFWHNKFSEYERMNFSKNQILYSLNDLYKHLEELSSKENDIIELVWTGPEALNSTLRDTRVVAQELFREAKNEIIVVGFAFYQGKEIFKEIATKLDTDSNFRVVFIVDVRKEMNKDTPEATLVKFKIDFKNKQWPGSNLPDVYYDPRTFDTEGFKRSSMHAKCIIVDSKKMLITSANFTQAAHNRNIEAGVVIDSKEEAISLKSQFFNLVEAGLLKKI